MAADLRELIWKAAVTVATLLATDVWAKAKAGIGSLWHRVHPGTTSDPEAGAAEEQHGVPAAAPDAGQTHDGGITVRVRAAGKSRVNVNHADGNQYIIEHHVAAVATIAVIAAAAIIVPVVWPTGSPGTHAPKPTPTPKPAPNVTTEKGLLESSDLGGLDRTLKQTDIQLRSPAEEGSAACGKGKVHPTSDLARIFSDSQNLSLTEVIEAFPSQVAAKDTYKIQSSALSCRYSASTNISGVVSGLGAADYAIATHYSSAELTESAYVGTILFGRYLLILAMQTPLDHSFDQVSTFQLYAYAAAHKVRTLPGTA